MSGARSGILAALVLAASASASACALEPRVARVYDGRVVNGPFVPSEAYAAYLRGVLAEEAGDDRTALAAFEEAAREDEEEDPEPLVRIGAVRCRMSPQDRGADDAFARAGKLDRGYVPLHEARARCAAQRGQGDAAAAMLDPIARSDRDAPSTEALWITLARARPAARSRAIALTVASGENVAAWDALLAWGRAHADAELVARGLEGLLRVSPLRAAEVELGALELLGQGHAGHARRVAAAVADASPELGLVRVQNATVARLAIDDALLQGDGERAAQRAVRGHVPLAEVAARALLLEQPAIATALARRVVAGDPSDSGAAMVLAATSPTGPTSHALPRSTPATDRPAAACVLALASRLVAGGNVEAARAFLPRVGATGLVPRDPLVGAVALDLAVRGVLPDTSLPPDLRLELAARRREPPSTDKTVDVDKLDAKHALLFHSLVDPTGAPARGLLARIGSAADRDPLVGFALARAALAAPPSGGDAWAAVRGAIAAAPTDPLLAAVAVELAKKSGRVEDVSPARARLLAVARTPAERALASE